MTENNENDSQLLGKVASLGFLLAAAFYFTGWTYRWAYFSVFNLEISSLNFPIESFYIAAFGTLFGGLGTIIKTAIALVIILGLVYLSLWAIRQIKLHSFLARRNIDNSIKFLLSLVNEIVIILWTFTVLFWLANWQGEADAWKDAVNETSFLPVVTIVVPDDTLRLGRKLNDESLNPKDFRVIGDRDIYTNLFDKELNDTSDPENPRVWRLLLKLDGYFYIFPALPSKDSKSKGLTTPVVLISDSDSGDRLVILSSQPTKN